MRITAKYASVTVLMLAVTSMSGIYTNSSFNAHRLHIARPHTLHVNFFVRRPKVTEQNWHLSAIFSCWKETYMYIDYDQSKSINIQTCAWTTNTELYKADNGKLYVLTE